MAEPGDTRGLLKDLPAVGALDGQDLINAALTDNGIALTAQTGVHEQLVDVLQPAGAPVDIVFALAGAVIPAGHRHLSFLHGEDVGGIVDDKGDLGKAQALPLGCTVKDHILHFSAPERFGGLFPHDPADGIGDIGFARSVGTHDCGDVRPKGQHRLVRKGLEALDLKRF